MSLQQTRYLHCRFVDGLSREDAAFEADVLPGEAALIDAAVERGEIERPVAPAPTTTAASVAATTGETEMARPKKQEQDNQEVQQPDFEKAVRIYRHDIKPAIEKAGSHAQEASTGYKAIKKEARVNTRAARFVFSLERESEEKRNDVLRSLRGMLGAMHIGITDDLVSKAEDEDSAAPIIPTAAPERPQLATVN